MGVWQEGCEPRGQRRLEEHHRGIPHRRRAAEDRQDAAHRERLGPEHEPRGGEDDKAVEAKPAGRGAKKDRRPPGVQAHGPSLRADRRKANGRTHERADDRAFTRRWIARRPAAEARREGASFVRAVRACRRVLAHDASALGARREARPGRQQRLRIGVEGGEGDRGIAVRSGESPAARSRGDASVARRHQSARRGDRHGSTQASSPKCAAARPASLCARSANHAGSNAAGLDSARHGSRYPRWRRRYRHARTTPLTPRSIATSASCHAAAASRGPSPRRSRFAT